MGNRQVNPRAFEIANETDDIGYVYNVEVNSPPDLIEIMRKMEEFQNNTLNTFATHINAGLRFMLSQDAGSHAAESNRVYLFDNMGSRILRVFINPGGNNVPANYYYPSRCIYRKCFIHALFGAISQSPQPLPHI